MLDVIRSPRHFSKKKNRSLLPGPFSTIIIDTEDVMSIVVFVSWGRKNKNKNKRRKTTKNSDVFKWATEKIGGNNGGLFDWHR